jgi:hypothetical protein
MQPRRHLRVPEPFEEYGLAAEFLHAVGDDPALIPQLVHHARDEHPLLARPRPELLVGERLARGAPIHDQSTAGTFHCLEDTTRTATTHTIRSNRHLARRAPMPNERGRNHLNRE